MHRLHDRNWTFIPNVSFLTTPRPRSPVWRLAAEAPPLAARQLYRKSAGFQFPQNIIAVAELFFSDALTPSEVGRIRAIGKLKFHCCTTSSSICQNKTGSLFPATSCLRLLFSHQMNPSPRSFHRGCFPTLLERDHRLCSDSVVEPLLLTE